MSGMRLAAWPIAKPHLSKSLAVRVVLPYKAYIFYVMSRKRMSDFFVARHTCISTKGPDPLHV